MFGIVRLFERLRHSLSKMIIRLLNGIEIKYCC